MNELGLEEAKTVKVADQLNSLLANYQIFYQNLRGFHWNLKGENFFELHVKFEEWYGVAQERIDEIAERILTLDSQPMHSYSSYLDHSEIRELTNITDGREGVKHVLDNLTTLVQMERDILNAASDANDEGTVTLMSDYITDQEKTMWMLKSFLS